MPKGIEFAVGILVETRPSSRVSGRWKRSGRRRERGKEKEERPPAGAGGVTSGLVVGLAFTSSHDFYLG